MAGISLIMSHDDPFAYLTSKITVAASIGSWTVAYAIHALMVTSLVWLFRIRTKQDLDCPPKNVSVRSPNWISLGGRLLGGGLILLLAASFLYFYCLLLPAPAYSPLRKKVTGDPNHYPDLIAAAETLSTAGLGSSYPPIQPGPALANAIAGKAETFADVDRILQSGSYSCIDWASAQFEFEGSFGMSGEFRDLAHSLSNRALQSLSEGRYDDVVADGVRCLELANQISIDGTFVLAMVGTACEGIGIQTTVSGINGASVKQLEEAATQLDKMINTSEALDAELARLKAADIYFMSNTRSAHWLDRLTVCFLDRSSTENAIRQMLVRRNVWRDLLRTEIAIKLYRSEIGHAPDNLNSLVPDFLAKALTDGYSDAAKQPYRFEASEDRESYHLYSVGKDGDDDSGEIVEEYWEEGDFDLIALFGDRLASNAKEVAEYEAEQARIALEEKECEEEFDAMEDEDWESSEPLEIENLTEVPSDDQN